MLDKPVITQATRHDTAVIRLTVPRAEIRYVMGPAFQELVEVLTAQGIATAGPRYCRHLKMDPDVFDLEAGVSVAAPITAQGRVKPGELPGQMVARTIYQGPYEGLGDAWSEFMGWIMANGHTPDADLWEIYTTGPETSPDPATWRTELNRPLTSR